MKLYTVYNSYFMTNLIYIFDHIKSNICLLHGSRPFQAVKYFALLKIMDFSNKENENYGTCFKIILWLGKLVEFVC